MKKFWSLIKKLFSSPRDTAPAGEVVFDILWTSYDVDEEVESVYRAPEQGPASLAPHDAAEILLLTRWFELRPKELKRTATPKKWLASGGIRTGALA